MTIVETLIAIVNRTISSEDALRSLFAHRGWLVPLRSAPGRALEANVASTHAAWLMSGDENYQAACAQFSAEAIGEVTRFEHVDEILARIPDDVRIIRIEPGGPITQHCEGPDLETIQVVARAVGLERALRERQYDLLLRGRYLAAYYGTEEAVVISHERGNLLPIFTTTGAANRFYATGSPQSRARVRFVAFDGSALFGEAADAADGVIVNCAGPETFMLDVATCRAIAAS